eukprot:1073067-Pleurochrysis_carterae.AAC.1
MLVRTRACSHARTPAPVHSGKRAESPSRAYANAHRHARTHVRACAHALTHAHTRLRVCKPMRQRTLLVHIGGLSSS